MRPGLAAGINGSTKNMNCQENKCCATVIMMCILTNNIYSDRYPEIDRSNFGYQQQYVFRNG
jgi:hypothetical protein